MLGVGRRSQIVSLDDLGNIGEFVGAIGVVISLAYLAVQIRQNTRQLSQNTESAKLAASEATNREFNGIRDQVIRDPEVADLYLRGLRDFGSLDPRDRLRFGLLLQNFFFTFLTLSEGEQLYGDEGLRGSTLDGLLRHPGAREWWKRAESGFRPEFVRLVNGRIQELTSGTEAAAQQGAAAAEPQRVSIDPW
jgi:hypothetical protein